jgi:hypothetical protein
VDGLLKAAHRPPPCHGGRPVRLLPRKRRRGIIGKEERGETRLVEGKEGWKAL